MTYESHGYGDGEVSRFGSLQGEHPGKGGNVIKSESKGLRMREDDVTNPNLRAEQDEMSYLK